ncbi:MAG: class I fructose-bisphosphate aldolase, partial [Pseudomonadota bacterium]|nr:class I fructose-bisphosphate aldolase [Pseudomonadota bacterium]
REMLFRSLGMKNNIGGVILFDETIRQRAKDGTPLIELINNQGALPGIKVDKGLEPLQESPEESLTQGLEGLDERCREYEKIGARFAKWRAVIRIGESIPSQSCIDKNMQALADYAKIVQKNKMVPIVEPEVLMDGDHSIERCFEVSRSTLSSLFNCLDKNSINIKGTLLKPSMVTSGSKAGIKADIDEVAELTLKCLKENVPNNLPGITFLSGGQSDVEATAHLDAMNKIGGFEWKLSFSYGRALQQPALKAWLGKEENIKDAQRALSHRALMNRKAAQGLWDLSLESN